MKLFICPEFIPIPRMIAFSMTDYVPLDSSDFVQPNAFLFPLLFQGAPSAIVSTQSMIILLYRLLDEI